MITIQNVDSALKSYYLDAITKQLNENISPFFSAIEKKSEFVSGKDVKIAVMAGHAGNIAAGDEDGELPAPYSNRYIELTAGLKNLYGTIEISDKALRASRDSAGSFVNLLNAEMEGLISNAKQHFGRMLFGDGSGKLCELKSKRSDGTYQADYVSDLFVGLKVDVCKYDGSVYSDADGITILAVNAKDKSVTLSNVINGFTFGSMYVHGAKDKEITGLGAIFGGKTLYGHNSETEPYFQPYSLDADGELTEAKLAQIMDYMEENRNSTVNFIYCSYKTKRRIASLLSDKKLVINTIDANTGFGRVTVNGVPVYADKYCADDNIYFLNTDDFALYQLCDWEWLEDEDGKILRQVPGKAGYSATLVKYAELVCRRPSAQAVMKNLGTYTE